VESKWKNYHIATFPRRSLSKTGLSLEEAMDLSRDRQIEEEEAHTYTRRQNSNFNVEAGGTNSNHCAGRGLDSSGSGLEPVAGSCEHGDNHPVP
jgi:hypothetical protein